MMLMGEGTGRKGKRMSRSKLRPPGRDDYLTFLRSSPRFGWAMAACVLCLLAGVVIGITTGSAAAGLWGGSLLILGAAVLIDIAVKFYQWERARPAGEKDLSEQPAGAKESGPLVKE
jgi:hypothetical protein